MTSAWERQPAGKFRAGNISIRQQGCRRSQGCQPVYGRKSQHCPVAFSARRRLRTLLEHDREIVG